MGIFLLWQVPGLIAILWDKTVRNIMDSLTPIWIEIHTLEDFVRRFKEEECVRAEVIVTRIRENGQAQNWVCIRVVSTAEWKSHRFVYAEEKILLPLNDPEADRSFIEVRARTIGQKLAWNGIRVWVYDEFGNIIYPRE